MKATAKQDINISKEQRIVKGQEVNYFRLINNLDVKLIEVITEKGSFHIQESYLTKFFTIQN